MPLMNGMETIRKIRKRAGKAKLEMGNTRVLALSAISAAEFYTKNHAHLFDGFHEKPVSLAVMRSILHD